MRAGKDQKPNFWAVKTPVPRLFTPPFDDGYLICHRFAIRSFEDRQVDVAAAIRLSRQ